MNRAYNVTGVHAFLFLLLVSLVILSGCTEPTKIAGSESFDFNSVNSDQVIWVDELNAQIFIPESYIVFDKNMSPDNEAFQTLEMSGKEFLFRMNLLGASIDAIALDNMSEILLNIKQNDFTKEVRDLKNASEDTILGLGLGFSKAFGEYSIYESNQLKFLVFEYEMDHVNALDHINSEKTYVIKYKTIVSSKDVTILYQSLSPITNQDRQKALIIAESLTIGGM